MSEPDELTAAVDYLQGVADSEVRTCTDCGGVGSQSVCDDPPGAVPCSCCLTGFHVGTLRAHLERWKALPALFAALEEEIKHTSHADGLGMGDQRSESVVRWVRDRVLRDGVYRLVPEEET